MSVRLEAREPSARYLAQSLPLHIQQFDLIADATGGVERLRELILSFAIRGLLVTQDARDEPASTLLERSRAEVEKQMRQGTRKKEEPSEAVGRDELPFAVPKGWVWCRLVDTAQYTNGLAFKPTDWKQTGMPIIRIQNLSGKSREFNRAAGDFDPQVIVQSGDVLVSWSATLDAFIWRGETGVLNQHIFRVEPAPCMEKRFLYWLLKWAVKDLAGSDHAHGLVMSHVNRGPFLAKPVPLPPLAEQARIVARVDELMHLCDALEAKGRLEAEQHARLLDVLLGTLTASATPEELAVNWQRVAAHFDLLLDRPEAVDALEHSILQIAVQGLLNTRHPSDEPADALVSRLAVRRGIRSPPISPTDVRWKLPQSWAWVRFDELIDPHQPISYGVLVPGPDQPDGVPFVRIADLSLTAPASLPEKRISPAVDAKYMRTRLRGGEILMGVVGSVGKLGIAPASWAGANIARAICRIVPAADVNRDFVLLLLQTELMQTSFAGDTRTLAQPTLNVGLIRNSPAPLPPLAEQARIVARVTELRRLCAELRERLAASRRMQSRLADALVETALA